MKLLKIKNATSQRPRFLVKSQTTGLGVPGLASNTAGLSVSYHRAGDTSSTAVSLVAGTLGTYVNSGGAGTGGGFVAVDATNMPGLYEFSAPDACWAGGDPILYINVPTGSFCEPIEYQMVGVDVTLAPGTAGALLAFGAGTGQVHAVAGVVDANDIQINGVTILPQSAVAANLTQINGVTQSATNLADLVNTGYSATTHKIQGVVLTDATTIPSAATIAAAILATPANLLATDGAGRVTAGTVADKTGYALTTAEHTATVADVRAGLAAQGYTTARAPNLDNLDALVSTRSTYAGGDTTGTTALLGRLTSGRATNLDNLDALVSSRLAASGYTAPPSTSQLAAAILATPGNLLATDGAGKVGANNLPGDYQQRSQPVILPSTAPSGYGGASTTAIATAVLTLDWTPIVGEASHSVLNALRFGRNRWTIDDTTGALVVYKEDGVTVAWTGTATFDAAGKPISALTAP